ncbi:MAG: hypothetical protein COC24_019305 [Alphaproteobacteria bacterium]|nr:hypothetical protein [Alphaproteobacteria bacterium]
MKQPDELNNIAQLVCNKFGISLAEIRSRKRRFALARLTYMYLAGQYTAHDATTIASVVCRSVKMAETAPNSVLTKCEWDGDFADKVNQLERRLGRVAA